MAGVRIGGTAVVPADYVPYEKNVDEIWYVPMASGSPVLVYTNSVGGARVASPMASPDFSQIVFIKYVSGDEHLWIVNRDGSGDAELEGGRCRYPFWHPDGSKILFTTFNSGSEGEVVTIEPDGTNRTVVKDISPNTASRAIYNHDGSLIAYFDDDAEEVWVMNADGTGAVKVGDLASGFVSENSIAWMNAADTLAFGSGVNGGDLTQVDADGSNSTVLTTFDGSTLSALSKLAYSPDDGTVFFANFDNSGGHYTLWQVPSAGGADSQVSPAYGIARLPPLVLGTRIWADGEDVPATTTLGLTSILPDGSDLTVFDPDMVRLEYPN